MRRFLNVLLRTLIALCAAGVTNAQAWSAEGHRLIAELGAAQLTPAAAAEANRLMGLEPGATMASVSTWADEKRAGVMARLHYVNLPEGDCSYSQPRDCPDGRCVVEAIAAKVAILKSTAPDAERLAALKWVIHLVGDVHQPLHAGLVSDKGGNLHQVRAFGRGANVHAVWDKELIRRRAGGLSQLLHDAFTAPVKSSKPVDAAQWASESCTIRSASGFYPNGRVVGPGYAAQWDGTLVAQLAAAGQRLAAVLNDALDRRRGEQPASVN